MDVPHGHRLDLLAVRELFRSEQFVLPRDTSCLRRLMPRLRGDELLELGVLGPPALDRAGRMSELLDVEVVEGDQALAGRLLLLGRDELGEPVGLRVRAVVALGVLQQLFVGLDDGVGETPSRACGLARRSRTDALRRSRNSFMTRRRSGRSERRAASA